MIALVTGAAGFIGRNVARLLAAQGWDVHGIGHGAWAADEAREWGLRQWLAADVAEPALRAWGARPSLVVHCAGGASVAASMERPAHDFERSVGSTVAVLEFLRVSAPDATFVLLSSAAVYGSTDGAPAAEAHVPKPQSVYGFNKLAAEQLTAAYARLYGIPAVVIRLFSAYGTGLRKQLLWDACRKLQERDLRFAGSGDEVRDFLHVEDVASLVGVAARHASAACPVVNGGTGIGATVHDVVTEIARNLGAPPPEFTGAERRGDPKQLVADTSLSREWGWQPRMSWRDGIREYCEWYKRLAS